MSPWLGRLGKHSLRLRLKINLLTYLLTYSNPIKKPPLTRAIHNSQIDKYIVIFSYCMLFSCQKSYKLREATLNVTQHFGTTDPATLPRTTCCARLATLQIAHFLIQA